jgi:hypothetical protein
VRCRPGPGPAPESPVRYRPSPAGRRRPGWRLRRDNGITWDEFSEHELRQLDPNLSRDYVKGAGARERPHDQSASVDRTAGASLPCDGGRIERRRGPGSR